MKIKITVETFVETDDYDDVKTPMEALNLIAEAMEGLADWPDAIIKNEDGQIMEMQGGFRKD